MSSSRGSTRRTKSTAANRLSTKPRKSSAYNDDFGQHLIDHGVYPEAYEHPESRNSPEPANSIQMRQELLTSRASLSPSALTESVFRDFKRKNKTKPEGIVMPNGSTDFFDGARASKVQDRVRHALDKLIIPTRHANSPVVPNFFLEVKSPDGGALVAQHQACYDGAHGARAIHALQNYEETEPIFDGNAYTYSSTYHSGTGTLQLYAHHITAPTTADEQPEYHMTQIDGWQMTGNINCFSER
ncbi:hypothetical protein NOR_03760 [Metarhizium rileyi]|uniref:Uncharacterized protein n=1 Tax=Metarhizium rileyi (strain RCEF 4871) TaxID=1649241 RepID=A0A167FAS7_METRR|nr:hypothetical protein NOR_03760 [Metarhizium rileyi RCEF 4871]